MRPRPSVVPALRRQLGAFFIFVIAAAGCRDIDSPVHPRSASSALADKSGIPDTLPFHVDEDFRPAPGSTPFACGPGLSIPNRLIGEGTIAPHMGRTRSLIDVMGCQINDGIPRFTAADTVVGATGDSLFLGWIVTMPQTRNNKADLTIEILGLGGSGWFRRTRGSAMATGNMDLESGSGSYRGSGSIAPLPEGPIARAPLLIPETITTGGDRFTCGLTSQGAAYCWGQNDHGQLGDGSKTDRFTPTPVFGGLTFREISTGQAHTCALRTTGSVYCWGTNSTGQLGTSDKTDHPQPTLVPAALVFIQINAGGNQTCGRLLSGTTYCWGDNRFGQLGDGSITERDVPTLVKGGLFFNQVRTDSTHTCALTEAGAAYCWGANGSGELGDSTNTARRTPALVRGGHDFAQITVGSSHTCALDVESITYCWGENSSGQLGNGGGADVKVPTPVTAGTLHFTRISAGSAHTCAVGSTGVAWCWGANGYGQLGESTTNPRPTPAAVSSVFQFALISAGRDHSCGVSTSHVAYCWGNNDRGELGDNSTTMRHVPTQVSGAQGDLPSFKELSAGMLHTCGLTTSNLAYCWGENGYGSLGDETRTDREVPAAVAGGLHFRGISAGGFHTCALRDDGPAVCWGANRTGQLGDGTTTDSDSPVTVASTEYFYEIRAGNEHTCATAYGGVVYCWGNNTYGQLGDGTTTPRHEPTLVTAGTLVFGRIAAGKSHTCALTRDGAAYCWGNYGVSTSNTPVLVPTPEPFVALEAGDRATCGITRDTGKIYCWGVNDNGQLGDGTTETIFTPQRIIVAAGQVAGIPLATFSVGWSHVCVTAAIGNAAFCSGSNSYGQLGDNTTTERHYQSEVYGTLAFQWLAGGADHTCGLSSGAAYCWGSNSSGQLGVGDMTRRLIPTAVYRLLFKIP